MGGLHSEACQQQMVRFAGLVAILNRPNPWQELHVRKQATNQNVPDSSCSSS
jgi:hypothetical protein